MENLSNLTKEEVARQKRIEKCRKWRRENKERNINAIRRYWWRKALKAIDEFGIDAVRQEVG